MSLKQSGQESFEGHRRGDEIESKGTWCEHGGKRGGETHFVERLVDRCSVVLVISLCQVMIAIAL